VIVVTPSIVEPFVGAAMTGLHEKLGLPGTATDRSVGKIPHTPSKIPHTPKKRAVGQKTLHFPLSQTARDKRALLSVQNACSDQQMLWIISEGYSR
jgi:hypothetical protein